MVSYSAYKDRGNLCCRNPRKNCPTDTTGYVTISNADDYNSTAFISIQYERLKVKFLHLYLPNLFY